MEGGCVGRREEIWDTVPLLQGNYIGYLMHPAVATTPKPMPLWRGQDLQCVVL